MVSEEQEVRSIEITVPGQGEARLALTDRRVYVHSRASWQGEETSSIPLKAISFTTVSWQRRWEWLFAALAAIALGFFAPALLALLAIQPIPEASWILWAAAAVFVLVFIFYKPGKVSISSATGTLGGRPQSADEAVAFLEEVIKTLPDLREVAELRV